MRTMPMIWNKSGKDRGELSCAVCGRPLWEDRAYGVHVIGGGGEVLHPNNKHLYSPDSGDMGCHAVGPECRKKFGDFAFPWTQE